MFPKQSQKILFKRIGIIILLMAVSLSIQSKNIKTYYINAKGVRTYYKKAVFKRTVEHKNDLWVVKDYYLNGTLQMTGTYLDRKLQQKSGTFTFYHLNGRVARIYTYKYGNKNGEVVSFSITGDTASVGRYHNGKPVGEWKIIQFGDTIRYNYDNHGNGAKGVTKLKADFPGGKNAFVNYMKKLHYPENAVNESIYGKIIVSFRVNEKGKVDFAEVVLHGTPEMDSIALKHILNMPDWEPAMNNGKPVSTEFFLPVSFILNSQKIKVDERTIAKAFYSTAIKDYNLKEYRMAITKLIKASDYYNTNANYYNLLAACYFNLHFENYACEYWKIADSLDKNIIKPEVKKFCGMQ